MSCQPYKDTSFLLQTDNCSAEDNESYPTLVLMQPDEEETSSYPDSMDFITLALASDPFGTHAQLESASMLQQSDIDLNGQIGALCAIMASLNEFIQVSPPNEMPYYSKASAEDLNINTLDVDQLLNECSEYMKLNQIELLSSPLDCSKENGRCGSR